MTVARWRVSVHSEHMWLRHGPWADHQKHSLLLNKSYYIYIQQRRRSIKQFDELFTHNKMWYFQVWNISSLVLGENELCCPRNSKLPTLPTNMCKDYLPVLRQGTEWHWDTGDMLTLAKARNKHGADRIINVICPLWLFSTRNSRRMGYQKLPEW